MSCKPSQIIASTTRAPLTRGQKRFHFSTVMGLWYLEAPRDVLIVALMWQECREIYRKARRVSKA